MRKSSKIVITAAVAVALLGGGGSAFAWWSGAGSGTGSATTSAVAGTSNVVVKQTNAAITGLTPGGSAQALSGNFDNNGTVAVTVSGVAIALTVTQASGAVGTCTTADYTLVQPTTPASASTQSLPASTTATGSWAGSSIQMKNSASNQNGCLGATLAFAYSIS